MKPSEIQVLLASPDYEADVLAEIKFRKSVSLIKNDESVFWLQGSNESFWWPQWQLNNVQKERFDSISQAIRILKSKGRNWFNLDYKLHRRSALIQEGLPKVKIQDFVRGGAPIVLFPCGAWFLEENGLINYSLEPSIPYQNGIIEIPDDILAPSRAYRKLDEVFLRIGKRPGRSEKVLDLGSFPGGWTWVLSHLAGHVVSVDTVNLVGNVAKLPNVDLLKKDAFKLDPKDIGPIDWFFSDIICEPLRLYNLVVEWRKSGVVDNFICTIKFKGQVDFELLEKFQSIPNSKIFHLNANKHELTWVSLKSDQSY